MTVEKPSPPGDHRGSGIDTSVPHSARIWNYWLGGRDNYAVDRVAGDAYRKAFPGVTAIARGSRDFLVRSIRFLAGEAGLRQFLDVGTGLPTADNTHEVAQCIAPASRIVYVDNDPLVLVHAHALLTSRPEGVTEYVQADVREPAVILAAAATTLDLSQPVALILSGILGHVADYDEARAIVRDLMAGLAPGSHLSLNDGVVIDEVYAQAQQGYNDTGAVPYQLRTTQQIAGFFDGLDVVAPGVVPVPQWRPDQAVEGEQPAAAVGGVGRKP